MPDKLNRESNIIMVDKQYLIETNEKILKRHEKKHNVQVWIGTTRTIDDIIPHVDSVGKSGDRKEDLIEKAVNLMAKITHCQPFEDGNRRTGFRAKNGNMHQRKFWSTRSYRQRHAGRLLMPKGCFATWLNWGLDCACRNSSSLLMTRSTT